MRCLDSCEAVLLCKITYDFEVQFADSIKVCQLELQKEISLSVVYPFNFSAKFKSMKVLSVLIIFTQINIFYNCFHFPQFNQIDHVYTGDSFILNTEIVNTFPTSLIIETTEFHLVCIILYNHILILDYSIINL